MRARCIDKDLQGRDSSPEYDGNCNADRARYVCLERIECAQDAWIKTSRVGTHPRNMTATAMQIALVMCASSGSNAQDAWIKTSRVGTHPRNMTATAMQIALVMCAASGSSPLFFARLGPLRKYHRDHGFCSENRPGVRRKTISTEKFGRNSDPNTDPPNNRQPLERLEYPLEPLGRPPTEWTFGTLGLLAGHDFRKILFPGYIRLHPFANRSFASAESACRLSKPHSGALCARTEPLIGDVLLLRHPTVAVLPVGMLRKLIRRYISGRGKDLTANKTRATLRPECWCNDFASDVVLGRRLRDRGARRGPMREGRSVRRLVEACPCRVRTAIR